LLIVGTDPLEVDRLLRRGVLRCPGCAGELRPWGHARTRRIRGERDGDGAVVLVERPRRSSCSGCGATHVLISASLLVRRADGAVVIGAALVAKAAGAGHRPIAAALGRPVSTVRGWLRRFTARAHGWRMSFTALLHALDPMAGPIVVTACVVGDAVEVVGLAAAAAARRFGPRPPWQFASAATGGLLLGPVPVAAWVVRVANTS
jgi:hypothetical protein